MPVASLMAATALLMNVERQMFRVAIAADRTCTFVPPQSLASSMLESDLPTHVADANRWPPASDCGASIAPSYATQ
jgi:hypothetical protein